jgi:hypothetical protein
LRFAAGDVSTVFVLQEEPAVLVVAAALRLAGLRPTWEKQVLSAKVFKRVGRRS